MKQNNSHRCWQQAQDIEKLFWESTTISDAMNNCMDKLSLLKSLGEQFCSDSFCNKEILEIGVGPLGLSVASFFNGKDKAKRLVKLDPLSRKTFSSLAYIQKEAWARQFSKWLDYLGEEGEYIQIPAEKMEYSSEFDTVILHNTLDHAENPFLVLEKGYAALKKGGVIIIMVTCYSLAGFIKLKLIESRIKSKIWLCKAHPHVFLQNNITRLLKKSGFHNPTCIKGLGPIGKVISHSTFSIFIARK